MIKDFSLRQTPSKKIIFSYESENVMLDFFGKKLDPVARKGIFSSKVLAAGNPVPRSNLRISWRPLHSGCHGRKYFMEV
jgi:hypothetical protein